MKKGKGPRTLDKEIPKMTVTTNPEHVTATAPHSTPPPDGTPKKPSVERAPAAASQPEAELIGKHAVYLREGATIGYLRSILFGSGQDPLHFLGYRIYLEQLIKDAGNPSDPVERMMLEQIVMAHHKVGGLYVEASRAGSASEADIYNTLAARLLAEFRKTVLALQAYRGPTRAKPAAAASKKTEPAPNPTPTAPTPHQNGTAKLANSLYDELRSKHGVNGHHDIPAEHSAESKTGGRREAEPCEMAGAYAGRS
jgi:hypothetical protein